MKNMSLFSQLLKLFSKSTFSSLVEKHQTEYRSKGFSSWSQFVSMLFCQLGQASSLREISYGLQSCEGKLSHLGISSPKRSTLAYANKTRSWKLFEEIFETLLSKVTKEAKGKGKKFSFGNKLYSIDSSVIDLCLTVFDWAKYRTTKGAIKLHLRLDHDGYLPNFLLVTDGKVSDVKAAWQFTYEAGSITVFDRGYNDYALFKYIEEQSAFFVTRLKKNALYDVVKKLELPKDTDLDTVSDSIIQLTGKNAIKTSLGELRLIKAFATDGKEMFFLTNNRELSAQTISDIYRERWQIETFFKEIKQNLKIKTFVGTTENAVMTQIYTALISILLLKYLKLKSSYNWSMSNLAVLLRMNLFTQKNLWKWISKPFEKPPDKVMIEAIQSELILT